MPNDPPDAHNYQEISDDKRAHHDNERDRTSGQARNLPVRRWAFVPTVLRYGLRPAALW